MIRIITAALAVALLAGCGGGSSENEERYAAIAAELDKMVASAEAESAAQEAAQIVEGDAPFDGPPPVTEELSIVEGLSGDEIDPLSADDVSLDCEAGQVEITNTSTAAKHLYVQIYFSDVDGVRVGDTSVSPYNVEPGETVRETFYKDDPDHTCKLGELFTMPAYPEAVDAPWWWDA